MTVQEEYRNSTRSPMLHRTKTKGPPMLATMGVLKKTLLVKGFEPGNKLELEQKSPNLKQKHKHSDSGF